MVLLDRLTKSVDVLMWTNVKVSHARSDQYVRIFQAAILVNVQAEFPATHTKAVVHDQILLSAVMLNIHAPKMRTASLIHWAKMFVYVGKD